MRVSIQDRSQIYNFENMREVEYTELSRIQLSFISISRLTAVSGDPPRQSVPGEHEGIATRVEGYRELSGSRYPGHPMAVASMDTPPEFSKEGIWWNFLQL